MMNVFGNFRRRETLREIGKSGGKELFISKMFLKNKRRERTGVGTRDLLINQSTNQTNRLHFLQASHPYSMVSGSPSHKQQVWGVKEGRVWVVRQGCYSGRKGPIGGFLASVQTTQCF